MALLKTKEFYEILNVFEKTLKTSSIYVRGSYEREDKELWSTGYIYKSGEINDLFKLFHMGVEAGKSICRN